MVTQIAFALFDVADKCFKQHGNFLIVREKVKFELIFDRKNKTEIWHLAYCNDWFIGFIRFGHANQHRQELFDEFNPEFVQ